MIKAGVTDPTRPLGVFLFVGPTGTGKTEIAKALAEFLFGSADRLVRLDMSEYQTPESLERLLSDTSTESHGATLDLLGAQGAVRGGAARRVREGRAADLGPLPAGVRRRAADRPAGTRRRLPTLRHRSHLEPRRRRSRGGAGARLRAARPAVLGRRRSSARSSARSGPSSGTASTASSSSGRSSAPQCALSSTRSSPTRSRGAGSAAVPGRSRSTSLRTRS